MLNRLLWRVRAALRRRDLETELDTELQFHVDMQAAEHVRRGMSPEDARREAVRAFGGVVQHAESVRDQHATILDSVRLDLRFALRSLRRSPGYAAAVLLTLTLGIGATTATYSIVYSLLFRPLPVPHGERLVMVMGQNPRTGEVWMGNRQDVFTALHASNAFESIASYDSFGSQLSLRMPGGNEPVSAAELSSGFFAVVGVPPEVGRPFGDDECRPGKSDVVVLSHEYWLRRFGGDRGVLGRRLDFTDRPRTVVGIMPRGFWYPRLATQRDPDVLYPTEFVWEKPLPGSAVHFLIARLSPGVSLSSAQAAANVVAANVRRARVADDEPLGLLVSPFRREMGRFVRSDLLLVQGAVLLLTIVAAANAANLMLARNRARHEELAVRATLGASRARVVRQLVTEALLLAVVGGACGVVVAWGTVRVMVASLPSALRVAPVIGLDWHVLLATLALSLAVGLACGAVPAWVTTERPLWPALAAGRHGRGRKGRVVQSTFVALQAALTVVLLTGTALVVQSLMSLSASTLGFGHDLSHLARVSLDMRQSQRTGETAADTSFRAAAALRRVRDVEATGVLAPLPFTAEVVTSARVPCEDLKRVDVQSVTPDALMTLGLPSLRGRGLRASDAGPGGGVLINERFASKCLGGRDALGRALSFDLGRESTLRTIVGVVADVRDARVHEPPLPRLYVPLDPSVARFVRGVVVRTRGAADDAAPGMTEALRKAGIVATADSLAGARDRGFRTEKFYSLVVVTFGTTAFLIAIVGIAGVVRETVVRRTREFGIRIACGARPVDAVQLAVGQVTVPVLAGMVAGGLAARWFGRALRGLLFEVSPGDPGTLASVLVFVAVAALAAAYVPAREASRVDPVAALKVE